MRIETDITIDDFRAFLRYAVRCTRQSAQAHGRGKAPRLEDLRIPPGNRLEALVGDRRNQHSIRINQQFRICFVWSDAGPLGVEIVDYH